MNDLTAVSAYNESGRTRFPMNLSSAARALGVTIQRLSRYLKALEIPVTRVGYTVLIDSKSYARAKRAIDKNVVKRGRKKKSN